MFPTSKILKLYTEIQLMKLHVIKVGDLVIVHKENAAPLTCSLGRITTINPGSDNKVRVAKVKTKDGFRVISRSTTNFKTRNPPEPHWDRKWMLEVCKPVYLPLRIPAHETCPLSQVKGIEEPHPYDVILSKELKESFDSSKMMLVYHVNSLTNEEKKTIYRSFFVEDLSFSIYDNDVLRYVFDGTKYQALMHLFQSTSGVVFSADINISKALKLSKQLSDKLILLGGVIEDRILSKTNLEEISQIYKRNIHGEMVNHIRSPATGVYRSLNYQMSLLSYLLKQISEGKN